MAKSSVKVVVVNKSWIVWPQTPYMPVEEKKRKDDIHPKKNLFLFFYWFDERCGICHCTLRLKLEFESGSPHGFLHNSLAAKNKLDFGGPPVRK